MDANDISEEMIKKVASLAALELKDGEVKAYRQQFQRILTYFDQINQVDCGDVEPLITPVTIAPNLREDVATNFGDKEALLEQAPERVGNLYRVPPVV